MTTLLALAAFMPVAALLRRLLSIRKRKPSGYSTPTSRDEQEREIQRLWAAANGRHCGYSPEPDTHPAGSEPEVHKLVRELLGPEATCTCRRVTPCPYPSAECPSPWIHHELSCPATERPLTPFPR